MRPGPKNLITVYLESMENTFGDAGLFGRNLLSVLDEATDGWGRYETLRQYPEGGWTMAGIVADKGITAEPVDPAAAHTSPG